MGGVDLKQCPECGSGELFVHGGIQARGGYGPDLLPGTSKLFSPAQMKAVVCKGCGLVRFYAGHDTLARVGTQTGWHRST
jgi:predicted nucleic-acid-binding Zn-ribbon protein